MIIEIVNDAMLKSWGKEKNIIGKSVFEVLPEIVDQGLGELLKNVFNTGKAFHAHEMLVKLNRYGKTDLIYYTFIYQAQHNIHGNIEGVAVIANEVTPQAILHNKLKESEENYRQLADFMPKKISNADEHGNNFYYNKSWVDYTGWSAEELILRGWTSLLHPEEIKAVTRQWQSCLRSGKDFETEFRLLNKNGEYLWHLVLASAVKDEKGKIVKWISTATEIQQQVEQREMLEKAVVKRTNELRKSNENLQKTNKELEAFAYVSSHDLQEPLRKIQTFAARLLDKENQNLSDKGKSYYQIIQDSARRMQTLIEDLLAFSRLSGDKLISESISVQEIIKQIKEDIKDVLDENQVVIEDNESGVVTVIPFQFRQLMQNLIGNAIKFRSPKRPLRIVIKSKLLQGKQIKLIKLSQEKYYYHISVADNGMGFEPEFKDKIFEVFQKLHGKEEYAGTGIGLAIVKKIVDNHQGVINATGYLHKGATFDIFIPDISKTS